MKHSFWLLLSASILTSLVSCDPSKRTASTDNEIHIVLDTIDVFSNGDIGTPKTARAIYNPSATRSWDLIHTKLDVSFDWQNQYLKGLAELDLQPYFYPQNNLVLDAKGFDIHSIEMLSPSQRILQYKYDGMQVDIDLAKTFFRGQEIQIRIKYTAKPNELEEGGSAVITSDKGLYFINPLGTENKPQQIWTQGETEASSCWFPTIDKPNERCSQDISITVQDKFATLSNGKFAGSQMLPNGMRKDRWIQEKPHAPYLFMMGIGEFEIVKDKWRDLDVWYYVEKEYAPYARSHFGNTPEMLEFYSKLFDYPYPWDKYHQIVVRDFVSGAMENTGAVVHFDGLNKTDRELLDNDHEDIIAHEAIHHWFGDLVTCENWANLPLNESFATYGEALWIEYKYSQDQADYHQSRDLRQYLWEASTKQVDLIRFDYDDKEDMFDAHSYQKGGWILRMLRHYVGDDAFFQSLTKYLKDNEYSAVEIHELRMAFEDVTGEDLNWFFNQWFLAKGHPILEIDYDYTPGQVRVIAKQTQNTIHMPIYKLPLKVDVYTTAGVTSHDIVFDDLVDTFYLPSNEAPRLVNFDSDKSLLCTKKDNHSIEEFVVMYEEGKKYFDRKEALLFLKDKQKDSPEAQACFRKAFQDPFWEIRSYALANYALQDYKDEELIKEILKIARDDEKSKVVVSAIGLLGKCDNAFILPFLEQQLSAQSYSVQAAAMNAIFEQDRKAGMAAAERLKAEDKGTVVMAVCRLLASEGTIRDKEYFHKHLEKQEGYPRYFVISYFGDYVSQLKNELIMEESIPMIKKIALEEVSWNQAIAINVLSEWKGKYEEEQSLLSAKQNRSIAENSRLSLVDTRIRDLANTLDFIEREIERGG